MKLLKAILNAWIEGSALSLMMEMPTKEVADKIKK